jgi:iron(III) transport system substrate-binding protein
LRPRPVSRRSVLRASVSLPFLLYAESLRAAAPAPEPVTPALIEAAKREGQVVWYTSADLRLAQMIGKAFEQKFSGISARVERLGAERIFSRIAQEYAAGIHGVDAANTGDAAQFLTWKKQGLLAPYVPEDAAKHFAAEYRDPDGLFAVVRSTLCVLACNTDLVKADEAPRSYADLLDQKWKGKIVKAHPAYSGTVITATYAMVRELGWDYFEKLSKQNVLQVQSATDTPNKVALGERAIMADGNEYNVLILTEAGKPIRTIYPREGAPLITNPAAIFKAAPHPNAARLFQSFLYSRETQQMLVDVGAMRSFHDQVKDKTGRTALSQIKVLKSDPAEVEQASEEIKRHYSQYFRV